MNANINGSNYVIKDGDIIPNYPPSFNTNSSSTEAWPSIKLEYSIKLLGSEEIDKLKDSLFVELCDLDEMVDIPTDKIADLITKAVQKIIDADKTVTPVAGVPIYDTAGQGTVATDLNIYGQGVVTAIQTAQAGSANATSFIS